MAKGNEKKQETTSAVALTEENVLEQVRNGNLLKSENVQAALEKIQKEKDERQIREAQNMIMCAEYTRAKELFQLRARRREDRITKECLKETENLLNEVIAGNLTPQEYQDKRREVLKNKDEKFRESNKEYEKNMNELRNSFTGEYRYMSEWDRY